MTKLEKIVSPLIFGVAFVAYLMSHAMSNEDFTVYWVAREDGFLEWLTVVALLFSAVFCWCKSWTMRDTSSKLFLSCLAIYGVVFFFGMGEEISWGQRLFGVETPEFLAKANAQKETNLHNLVIADTNINKLIFGKLLAVGLVAFLVALPMAYRQSEFIRKSCDQLAIPVPRLPHTLAILAVVLLVETSPASKRGEINEFALTSFVFLVLLNPLNGHIFRKASAAVSTPESEEEKVTRRFAA